MMEFLEMKNEANSDYVLNQFLLGNIRFWTGSDIVCRSISSFPFKSIQRSKICQNWMTESQDLKFRISHFSEVRPIRFEGCKSYKGSMGNQLYF